MNPTFRKIWPYLLLIVLAFAFLGDIWFGGKILLMRDFFSGEATNRSLLGASLRSGHFNLWWSNWQCGTPFVAQPYSGAFYPPNWIFIIPSVEWAARIWWTFHFAVAGISAYSLARYWRMAVAPALFAGVAFAFNTFCMAWLEFSLGFFCLSWLPLVIRFVSSIIDRTNEQIPKGKDEKNPVNPLIVFQASAKPIVGLAIVWALQVLASCEMMYYCCLLVGSFIVAKWIWHWNKRVFWFSAFFLGIAGVLALALAMPQLLMTFEMLGLSERAGKMDPCYDMTSASPRHWLTFLLPYLYGHPGYFGHTGYPDKERYWATTVFEFANGTCYVGILPLIAACFCWLRSKKQAFSPECRERRFLVWFLVAMAVFGLLMAAGQYTPLYNILHQTLPGFGSLRFPTKFFLFAVFALPILGAFGFQNLLDHIDNEPAGQRRHAWQFAAGLMGLLMLGYFICLCNDDFLIALMNNPKPATPIQVNSVRIDYTWAVAFAGAGLLLFGLLTFRIGRAQWVQGGIVAVAFINLCVISRQAQVVAPSGIYTQRPKDLLAQVKPDSQYRLLTQYGDVQQFLYGESRFQFYGWAMNIAATNHFMLEGIPSLAAGGLMLDRYKDYYAVLVAAKPPLLDKVEDILCMRYFVYGPPGPSVLSNQAPPEFSVYERPTALPRAFLTSQWIFAKDRENAWKFIVNDLFDPHRNTVLERAPDVTEAPPPCPPLAPDAPVERIGEIKSLVDKSDSLSMNVWLDKQALLVLNDSWYPGWSVKVDGVKRPIYIANYNFRGVFLKPGSHEVCFTYMCARFRIGICLFLLAALLCGALVWFARIPASSWLIRIGNRTRRKTSVSRELQASASNAPQATSTKTA